MRYAKDNVKQVVQEHRALMAALGNAQKHCSEQALLIKQMQAQITQLRADLVVCQTALTWERERAKQPATRPALPQRQRLERQMNTVFARLHAQLHAQLHKHLRLSWAPEVNRAPPAMPRQVDSASSLADLAVLEDSLHAADLVICQTGCVSHGNYWRVEDHCNRTGKPCVLVEAPDALRIVRIQTAQPHATAPHE